MSQRAGTGFADGYWSLPAGHVDEDEPLLAAASREMTEEIGVTVRPDAWRLAHVMHRRSPERVTVDVFLTAETWDGEPCNLEPEKCTAIGFFPREALPAPTVPYIAEALQKAISEDPVTPAASHYGWDAPPESLPTPTTVTSPPDQGTGDQSNPDGG